MKLKYIIPLFVSAATGILTLACPAAEPATIHPGTVWKDSAGNEINAHGGGILQVGDKFYWYGENRVNGKGVSISCYVSTNLVDWTLKNQVLSQSSKGLSDSQFERPKVIYNSTTRKYVLWAHRENLRDYGDAQAVVAQCDSPDGNFDVVKVFRPFVNTGVIDHGKPGYMSRDCNLYKDDDGTAWFISSSNENTDMMLYKLSPDYLDAVEHYNVLPGARREAPALFKLNGKYYLISSAATGWKANYNTIQEADKITGPYGPAQGLISRMGDSTFSSQANYVLPVTGSKGTTFIYMGDRWKPWNLPDSRYIWLPLRFDDGKFQPIAWGDKWQLDMATGLTTLPIDPVPSADNIALHKPVTCDKNNEPNGKEPSRIVDGSTNTGWAAISGNSQQWLKIDLGKPYKITASKLAWEGNHRPYKYLIEYSLDGTTWSKAVDNQHNDPPMGTNDDALDCIGRYFRLTMDGKGDGSYFWATCSEWELLNDSTNVALHKPVEASSAEWGRYSAKITDGDFGTYWSGDDGKPGHWATIDLGESHDLTACRLFWQSPGYYYQYKIEVSPDGNTWSPEVDMTANTVTARLAVHPFKASGRYVRLTLTGAEDGCWPAIAEIEVFAGGKAPVDEQYTPFRASSDDSKINSK